jgi:hypothetical protein
VEVGRLREFVHNLRHGFAIKDTCNVMGHGGDYFAPARSGQFGEQCSHKLAGHVGEGVAVEQDEGGAAMTMPKEFYGLLEREDL